MTFGQQDHMNQHPHILNPGPIAEKATGGIVLQSSKTQIKSQAAFTN